MGGVLMGYFCGGLSLTSIWGVMVEWRALRLSLRPTSSERTPDPRSIATSQLIASLHLQQVV